MTVNQDVTGSSPVSGASEILSITDVHGEADKCDNSTISAHDRPFSLLGGVSQQLNIIPCHKSLTGRTESG